MNLYKKKIERIKNMKGFVLKKDFNYSALSFLVLALFLAGGAILQLLLYPTMPHEAIVMVSTAVFTAAIVIALFPLWTLVMAIILILWVWVIGDLSIYLYPITAFFHTWPSLLLRLPVGLPLGQGHHSEIGQVPASQGPGTIFPTSLGRQGG